MRKIDVPPNTAYCGLDGQRYNCLTPDGDTVECSGILYGTADNRHPARREAA